MADEEAPPAAEGGEAAPAAEEAPAPEAPAEEAPPPAEEAPPSEAPAEGGAEAPAEAPPAEGEAPAEGAEGAPPAEEKAGEAAEGGEPVEGGEPPAEGEAESGAPAEEGAEGGEPTEEAKPPSEAGAPEDAEGLPDKEESSMAVKIAPSSKLAVGEKPSVSVLEEQRRARLEKYGSRARVALGSVIDIRRGSVMGDTGDRKVPRFLNSYKLDSDNPFNPEKVNVILETVMTEALENLTYDTDKCPKQAKWATSAIRAKIKELEFDRYKIVCLVTIGEKTGLDVLVTCRFLWDYDRDRYATFSLENTYVYGIAQCFGLYYE